jgi:TolB-like protein
VLPNKIPASELGADLVDHRYDFLERALPEMLMTDLAADATLKIVERVRVENLQAEINLNATGEIDPTTAQRAGLALQASRLVWGFMERQEGTACARVSILTIGPWTSESLNICRKTNQDLFAWESALAAALKARLRHVDTPVEANTIPAEGTVAVLPFDDNSMARGHRHLSGAIADLLADNLPAAVPWRIVERRRLNDVLDELHLQQTGAIDSTTALRVGRLLGAHFVLFGSYLFSDGKIRIDTRLTEVESGRTIGYWKSTGKESELSDVVLTLITRVKGGRAG